MEEQVQVPYMTLLHLGIISCPQCFVEMKAKKTLEEDIKIPKKDILENPSLILKSRKT